MSTVATLKNVNALYDAKFCIIVIVPIVEEQVFSPMTTMLIMTSGFLAPCCLNVVDSCNYMRAVTFLCVVSKTTL